MKRKQIFVMGSYAIGMTAKCNCFPTEGQTVKGQSFDAFYGGKGSNQAVAAKRLGQIPVTFCSCIGNDMFGKQALNLYATENIDSSCVKVVEDTATGAGLIYIDKNGKNEIVIVLGANEKFSVDDVENIKDQIINSEILLVQLEFSIPAVKKAISIAKENGVKVILNPAPYQEIDEQIYKNIDFLTPNETEAAAILKWDFDKIDGKVMANELYRKYGCDVIITLGSEGCYVKTNSLDTKIGTYPLAPQDTTGAGDIFNGALTQALASGYKLLDAIDFALAASSISVTRDGCIESIPSLDEVKELIVKGK